MQASTGRLYLGFWSVSLRNLPAGAIQHRLIDAASAEQLIRLARDAGTLRCGSSEDLVAPYKSKEARRHAQLCAALSNHLGISITLAEFLVTVEDGLTSIFPLDIIQLAPGARLLVVDCCYRMNSERTADIEDRFEVAEDSIEFHLFEPDAAGIQPSDIRPSAEAGANTQTEELPTVVPQGGVTAVSGNERRVTEATDDEGFVPVDMADTLQYPCVASAFLDHDATGEGRTIGIIVMQAGNAEDVRRAVREEWDSYFAVDVRVRPWRGLPIGFEALDPSPAIALLDEQFVRRPFFKYSATLHFNGA